MADHTRFAEDIHLSLTNADGVLVGTLTWSTQAPMLVTGMLTAAQLPREQVEALRNFCDTVLGMMDIAEMQAPATAMAHNTHDTGDEHDEPPPDAR